MSSISLQQLSGQFVSLATALNVGLVPQGNGTWFVPSTKPLVTQGMLCGGVVLPTTPTYAPRGILVQRPAAVTQIDAIADAFQDNLSDGVRIAEKAEVFDRAVFAANELYRGACDFLKKSKRGPAAAAEMRLFECLKGIGICVAVRHDANFKPSLITEGFALATELQEFLNPNSPAMALLAELDAQAVSMQPPNKGSGEDLAAGQRRRAMQKVGIVWRSFADYLMMDPEADGTPDGLIDAAIYRGAYYLYAGQDYNGLGALYEAASTHYYGLEGDEARTGQYALRAAWAYSKRPEEANSIILQKIDHVFFEHLMPNLSHAYCRTEAHLFSKAQKIAAGLSGMLRLPRDGEETPHG